MLPISTPPALSLPTGHPRPSTAIPARFKAARARTDTSDKYTGQRYQLGALIALTAGAYVVIDGPHDTFGVVLGVERKETPQGSYFLHQVRGVRRQPGFTPQLHWQN